MPTAKPSKIASKSRRIRPALLSRPRLDEERTTHRPIIVTQNGRASTLLVNISDFEDMRETLELLEDVRIAEEEIERGEVIPQSEARRQSRELLLALQKQIA